jgi:hypothetical protein
MLGPYPNAWVPAAPCRAYVRHLIDAARVPWTVVALYAGVDRGVVRTLLFGRDGRLRPVLPRSAAAALVAVTAEDLRRLRVNRVNARRARERIAALRAIGLSWAEVARLLQADAETVRRVGLGFQAECAGLTDVLARAACHGLGLKPLVC